MSSISPFFYSFYIYTFSLFLTACSSRGNSLDPNICPHFSTGQSLKKGGCEV
jgi:hypothetical protein